MKFIIILCSLWGGAFVNSATASENIVIIASPLEARLTDIDYIDLVKPGTIAIGYGDSLAMKFKIDDVLFGGYDGEEIVFYDRALTLGFPAYVTESMVYLFIVKANGHYILSNWGFLKAVEDDLFICGSMLNPYAHDGTAISPVYKKINGCESAVEIENLRLYFSKFDFKNQSYKKNNILKQ